MTKEEIAELIQVNPELKQQDDEINEKLNQITQLLKENEKQQLKEELSGRPYSQVCVFCTRIMQQRSCPSAEKRVHWRGKFCDQRPYDFLSFQ